MKLLKRKSENKKFEIDVSQLRWNCPDNTFKFKTTAELEPLNEIVGQKKAVDAIKIGAELKAKGYNIFVTGLSGTGRTTTVKQILEANATSCPVLYDYCYVNNFDDTDKPVLLKLYKGKGKKFQNIINDVITFLKRRIPKLFEESSYQTSRKKIIENFQDKEQQILFEFDEKIKPFGFIRGQLENEQGYVQPEVFPLIDGKPVQIETLEELITEGKLTRNSADKIYKQWKIFHDEIYDLARLGMKLMQEFRKELNDHDKNAAEIIVNSAMNEIIEDFPDEKVRKYIEDVKKYILDNLNIFVQPAVNQNQSSDIYENNKNIEKDLFNVFNVNVICDNSETESAPVVIETSPTYTNLFGTIEKSYDSRGFWKTDFTMIKSGSLLKADQGFLIVNANDLFQEAGVWQALRRVLLYDKLEIQPFDSYFQISQSALKPEPIEVNIKVVIIGGQTLYRLLYNYEKGFKKIFKINAQFDYEHPKTDDMLSNIAHFTAKICNEENLPHFDRSGVAAIAEIAVEYSGTKNKISLKFSDIADIIRESAHQAILSGMKTVNRKSVETANEFRKMRNNLIDEKLKEQILTNDVMIDTDGQKVGIINALTVYNNSIYSFGKPTRITANVNVGSQGIINIEREADMSGKIHNKGVFIISGFLRERFAVRRTLSLSASIAFEQNYGGIDGDSASAAEIYVILSALTKLPINQSVAITGSMNQKGDIQPIGGVNEKITGFYEICRERVFNGQQGCIIPNQNVKDLMLGKEIIEDVKKGNFRIWGISTIEEGVNILFGIEAGTEDENGKYTEDSLFGIADKRIDEFSKILKPQSKKSSIKNKKDSENEA